MQVANPTVSKFFDLHTTGLGYLNRIRIVKPKKGDSFLACSISALRGDSQDPETSKFDLRISGAHAQACVEFLKNSVDADQKVLVGFKIGDIYPEMFEVSKDGEKQIKMIIKGRLLQIVWAKIDGVPVNLPAIAQVATGTNG